jgi:phage gpG-like protein
MSYPYDGGDYEETENTFDTATSAGFADAVRGIFAILDPDIREGFFQSIGHGVIFPAFRRNIQHGMSGMTPMAPLTTWTVNEWKAPRGEPSTPIYTGMESDLMESLRPGGDDNIFEVDSEGGIYGTSHPHAEFAQTGTVPHEQPNFLKGWMHPGTPPRPFLVLTDEDIAEIQRRLANLVSQVEMPTGRSLHWMRQTRDHGRFGPYPEDL